MKQKVQANVKQMTTRKPRIKKRKLPPLAEKVGEIQAWWINAELPARVNALRYLGATREQIDSMQNRPWASLSLWVRATMKRLSEAEQKELGILKKED